VFSNIMLAACGGVRSQDHLSSAERRALAARRQAVQPVFLRRSWPNDAYHEAAGQHATNKGYKNAYLLAANYQAGKDSLAGFRALFTRALWRGGLTPARASSTKLGRARAGARCQADASTSSCRGHGINFIKQFRRCRPVDGHSLIVPGFGSTRDIIRRSAKRCSGCSTPRTGAIDSTTLRTGAFVAAFEKEYKRLLGVRRAGLGHRDADRSGVRG